MTAGQSRLVQWAINLGIPVLIKLFGPQMGLTPVMATFFAFTAWAILSWIMATLPENLVAILLPALYVISQVGTGKEVFAPWGSSIPWLIIGGMIMGMIMMQTGLSKRIALWSIRTAGLSFTRVLIGLMLAGVIISPFVPSVMGKSAIVSVICLGICQALKLAPGSREGATVFLIGFLSVACPKLAFLTGGGDVVIAAKIAGDTAGTAISWGEYFVQNFPLAMVYGALSFVLVMLVMRPRIGRDLEEYIESEYARLGPLQTAERKTIAIMAVMLALMATEKLHGVDAGYCLLLMGGACFLPGIDLMDQEKLGKLNFGVIFFVTGCMCIGTAATAAGVDRWIADLIAPLLDGSRLFATVGIFLVGMVANFLLTPLATLATLTGPFTQIGMDLGLSANVVAYSLIYGADQYLFPYEYAVLLYFYSSGYMRLQQIMLIMGLRAMLTLVFLVTVAVPYWQLLGIF